MTWQILCDFDGTIADCDVTDSLLTAYALPGWEEIEEEWLAGRIGSRECMARQVAMLRLDHKTLDAHLDRITIDPAFPAFAAHCRQTGIPLTIVSDGLDYSITRILGRYHLDNLPVIANRLIFEDAGTLRLDFPYASPDCSKASGTCKCRVGLTAECIAPGQRLLIGDGSSDFCAAGAVDYVFAKDKLLRYCEQSKIPHANFGTFAKATQLLDDLLRRPPVSTSIG